MLSTALIIVFLLPLSYPLSGLGYSPVNPRVGQYIRYPICFALFCNVVPYRVYFLILFPVFCLLYKNEQG